MLWLMQGRMTYNRPHILAVSPPIFHPDIFKSSHDTQSRCYPSQLFPIFDPTFLRHPKTNPSRSPVNRPFATFGPLPLTGTIQNGVCQLASKILPRIFDSISCAVKINPPLLRDQHPNVIVMT